MIQALLEGKPVDLTKMPPPIPTDRGTILSSAFHYLLRFNWMMSWVEKCSDIRVNELIGLQLCSNF